VSPTFAPEPVIPASIAALYGPGIALFGEAVVNSLQCHAEGIDGVIPPEAQRHR